MTWRKFSKLRKLLTEIKTIILSCSEKSSEKLKILANLLVEAEAVTEEALLSLHLLNYLFKVT